MPRIKEDITYFKEEVKRDEKDIKNTTMVDSSFPKLSEVRPVF